jgi:hypothetical protein
MIIAPVNLTTYEQSTIDNVIGSNNFPWFSQDKQTDITDKWPKGMNVCNSHFLNHGLMSRSEDKNKSGTVVDYTVYKFFHNIFKNWCIENNVTVNLIYRACLNFTFSAPAEHSVPHYDHDWPHYNWIMYLNTVPGTDTVFFDHEYNLVQEVPCIKNNAIMFERQLHAHRYSKENYRRLVLVFTFI